MQAKKAVHLNKSRKIYSIIIDISGHSISNTAKLVNKQNDDLSTWSWCTYKIMGHIL